MKPSKSQIAVLGYIVALYGSGAQPVTLAEVRMSRVIAPRHMTHTIASLIDRKWIACPEVGLGAYVPTEVGRALVAAHEKLTAAMMAARCVVTPCP
jgi:hypothetical protein